VQIAAGKLQSILLPEREGGGFQHNRMDCSPPADFFFSEVVGGVRVVWIRDVVWIREVVSRRGSMMFWTSRSIGCSG
jgi:hypothetical protein